MALLALLLSSCAQPNATPETDSAVRIVSMDYCADQFVLRFAPREHIVAVSPDARKHFSYMRKSYPDVPSVRASAEDVLALSPTMVVRSYGGGPRAAVFFDQAGVDVIQLGYPSDLQAVREAVLRIGAELGNAREAQRVVEQFDRRLAALRHGSLSPTVLYTTPGGVTSGPGSLVHEILVAAGLRNFERRPGWRDLPLERLVYEQPGRLANAAFGDSAAHVDPWTLARHPIARELMQTTPGVEIEGAWTSCGAWFLMDAIEALSAALGEGDGSAD